MNLRLQHVTVVHIFLEIVDITELMIGTSQQNPPGSGKRWRHLAASNRRNKNSPTDQKEGASQTLEIIGVTRVFHLRGCAKRNLLFIRKEKIKFDSGSSAEYIPRKLAQNNSTKVNELDGMDEVEEKMNEKERKLPTVQDI